MNEKEDNNFSQQDILNYPYLKHKITMDTRGYTPSHLLLFRFIHVIAEGSSMVGLIPTVFCVIRILQSIATFSIGTMFTAEENDERENIIHIILRLVAPHPRPIICGLTLFAAITSIISFYSGLYCLKRRIIGKKLAFFFYIFAGELPVSYLTPLASLSGYYLSELLKNNTKSLPIFILLVIVLLFSLHIMYIMEVTLISSIMYYGGRLSTCTVPKRSVLANSIFVFFVTFTYNSVNTKSYHVFLLLLLVSGGCYFLMKGKCVYFISGLPDVETLAKGIGMIVSGVLSFQIYFGFKNYIQVFFLTPVVIYLLSFWILAVYYRRQSKKKAEMLENCQDFNELPIYTIYDLVSFMCGGFYYGTRSAIEGDFIEWGISKFNASDLSNVMNRYASLLDNPPLYSSYLEQRINPEDKTFEEEFIIYEYFVTQDARAVKDTPKELVQSIKETTERCKNFPLLEEKIIDYLSADSTTNFYLSQLMNDIRDSIGYYVWSVTFYLPNSILAMKLSYEYNLHVINDKIQAEAIKQDIDDLETDRKKYVKVDFMRPHTVIKEAHNAITEYNAIQFNSYGGKLFSPTGSFDSIKKQEDTDDEDDILVEGNKNNTGDQNIDTIISAILILLIVCSLVSAFMIFHLYFFKYCRLLDDLVVFSDYKFQATKLFAEGSVGAIIQISGDGNNSMLSYMKEICKNYTTIEDQLNLYKNRRMRQSNSDFDAFYESTTTVLVPRIEKPELVTASTYSRAVEKFFDCLYEAIDTTKNSTRIDKTWFAYLSSLAYYLTIASYEDSNGTYYEAYDTRLTNIFNDLRRKYNFAIIPICSICVLSGVYVITRIISIHVFTSKMPNNKDDVRIIKKALERSYTTLTKLAIRLFVMIIISIILALLTFSINILVAGYLKTQYEDYILKNSNYMQSLLLGYTLTVSFEYANYIDDIIPCSSDELYKIINSSLESFLINDFDQTTLILDRIHINQYKLMQKITMYFQDDINTSIEFALSLRDSFLLEFVPSIEQHFNTSTANQNLFADNFDSFLTVWRICTLLILTLIAFILIRIVIRIRDAYISVLVFNPFFAELIETTNDAPIESKQSPFEINCIKQPCAITTDKGNIINVNHKWKIVFGRFGHKYIGKKCSRYTRKFPAEKMFNIKLMDDIWLTIIDFYSDELSYTEEYKKLFDRLVMYRMDAGLSMFINENIDMHHYKFITCITISWNPKSELDPYEGREEIFRYIDPLLLEYNDIDFLRRSVRQSMFFFGLRGTISEELMAIEALTFAMEMLVLSSQNGILKNFNPSIAVVSGDATFSNPEDKIGCVDLSGGLINKLPLITAKSVPNSITICQETYQKSNEYDHTLYDNKLFKKLKDDNKGCDIPFYQYVVDFN